MIQIVYIVTAENKSIEVWKLLDNGKIILIQIINTDDAEGQPLLILKKRNKIYVGIRPNYKILVYDILIDGKLKKIGAINIPHSPNYLTTDSEEQFLFCSYYHANCMSISYIQNNHLPTNPIKIINDLKGCHSSQIDKFNKLIFLPALLEDRIYFYDFQKFQKNKNIFLEKIHYGQCIKQSGPRHMVLHPNNNYLYHVNELNGTVDVWKINYLKKKIKHIQNISLLSYKHQGKFWSADIHITSCGKYLYVSDRLHNNITLFKVNYDNKINFIKIFYTAKQPKSFAIDHNNQYLLSLGQKSNTVIIYNISKKNGFLNKIYEYSVGKNPTWILIHQI